MSADETVRLALDRHGDFLSRLPNVVGVGIGERRRMGGGPADLCVAVYVSRKLPVSALAEGDLVPATLEVERERVRTRVIEVGPFQKEGGSHGSEGFSKEGG